MNVNNYCFSTLSHFESARSQFFLPFPHQTRTKFQYTSFFVLSSTLFQEYASDTNTSMSSVLSPREQEMICYVWQSCKTPPDVSSIPLSLSIPLLSRSRPLLLFPSHDLLLLRDERCGSVLAAAVTSSHDLSSCTLQTHHGIKTDRSLRSTLRSWLP